MHKDSLAWRHGGGDGRGVRFGFGRFASGFSMSFGGWRFFGICVRAHGVFMVLFQAVK